MTIDISNNNPRASYAVAQGATQTSFTVNFEFFENADLNVYVDGTKKSLTTHYTVSGGSGSTGTVTMSVTGATGGSTVVITRDTTIERTTDFSAGADINRAALNTQLDTLTAMVADIEDQASRAVQVSDHETAPSLELPSLDSRKGTVMGFNASTGAVEAGPKLADVSTLAAVTADIATLADIEDGTDATDAIQTAASNSSNISTVAGISGNVTTVAGIASNVTSVAGNATNINTVAGDTADINALAGKTTELGLLGTSDAVSDMNTLGTSDVVSDMNTLGTSSNVTNMDTLAGISGNITTVAGVASNVTTVAGSISNVNTTASNISSVNTNATNISAIQGASGNASTATTKASEAATSATNAASSATSAATAQTAAEAARDSALAAFDSFDDRYLGSKSSAPSVDNDGDALVSGALYYDTTANAMQVYTGSAWVAAYASLSGALLVTNNLSDVNNAATSATNLGLGTGNTPTFNGVNTTGDISFGDSDKAKFGASNDLNIYHDGNNSYIEESGTGQLVIRSEDLRLQDASGTNWLQADTDGAVRLYHNNSRKLATTSTGVDVTGNATFADDGKAIFGAGSDLQIYHDGSNSYVDDTGTGALILRGNSNVTIGKYTGETMAYFEADGASYLYHNNAIKLQTTANGIKTSTDGSSSAQLDVTSGSTWSIRSNPTSGTNSYGLDFIKGSGGTDVKMALNSSGYLGIGYSSPTHLLHVRDGASGNGSMCVGGGAGLEISHDNSGSTTQRIDSLYRTTSDNANLQLRTGTLTMHTGASNAERMRIDSSGNVGINNNSPSSYSGSADNLVVGSSGSNGITIASGTSNAGAIYFADGTSGNAAYRGYVQYQHNVDKLVFGVGSDDRVIIESDGDLHVDGNVIAYSTTISDERLKEDIKPIEGALDKVGQLSGYTFTYKADGKQSAGVIAQEVEAVLPSAVTESTLPLKTDDDVEYKTVQYDQLHGLLIEAIKELKAEIEELKHGSAK